MLHFTRWEIMVRSRMVKFKNNANITFLVMLIMFISSLLWLLVSQYVQYMIKTAFIYQNYYSTYYLTYWWLELWLTQVKYHGYGFESIELTTWASCRSVTCQVVTTVTSRSSVIANSYDQWGSCNDLSVSWWTTQTFTSLWSGDCFIIPLYYDTAAGFDAISYYKIPDTDFLNTSVYDPSLHNEYVDPLWTGEEYSVRIIDEWLNNLNSLLEPTTESPTPYDFATAMPPYSGSEINYFIIANPSATTKEFCLELANSNELTMKFVNVVSIWEDGNNTISLNAIKNNELPSFLCYGAINP